MDKTKFRSPDGLRLPFFTNVLHFEQTYPYPIRDCLNRLKKIGKTQLSTELVLVRVDSELHRFHLRSRAFRVHLLEAQGYLRRVDDNNTQITGSVFSSSIASMLFGTAFVIAVAVAIALPNLLVIITALVALALIGLYCQQLVENAHREQRELVRQMEAAITTGAAQVAE